MVSKALIAVIILVVVLAVVGAVYFMIFPPAESPATLVVRAGTVDVNSGNGWRTATSGMQLSADYSVRTGTDGDAVVIFFGASALRLGPNTEIRLSEILANATSVEQISGQTWSRILKVSGIEKYEIETPTTVATVRGTGFAVVVSGNDTDVTVGEGAVNVGSIRKEIVQGVATRVVLAEVSVSANQTVEIKASTLEQPLVVRRVEHIDAWVAKNIGEDVTFREEVKTKIRQKYSFLIGAAKDRYGLTDADVDMYLDKIISGEIKIPSNVQELLASGSTDISALEHAASG
jgi:hypothetical protein